MRSVLTLAALAMLCSDPASAQTAVMSPGLGATSPLGTLGSNGSSGTGGISTTVPLAATEVAPGGLSPAPASTCNSTGASTAMGNRGSTSTFDGGGMSSISSCISNSTSTTTASASDVANSAASLVGGTIPLDAVETAGAGLSPMVPVPAPSLSTISGATALGTNTPCMGSVTSGSDVTTMAGC
ncbi:hypothetical protein [Bradyrhizobium sp. 15]|uniref:hypothetical protein n=1 Tax=Bradyrhizobium sp. 15 TaxID=2782633 RepID=UPI001FF81B11|nr:hypothetical protein [Bradyrhizobium sp. 15]MCK1439749.1 hypothetical protein [Bradyrhizobium sp. 15]